MFEAVFETHKLETAMMIQYDENVCRDLEAGSHREWLETNGLGSYASSTISGMNTRRYHGLLVAATHPPVGRMVLLSKIEETLIVGGKAHDLSVNRYPGVVHPQGHLYLKQFRLDPFPVYTYEVDGVQLEKRVCMVDGENTTVIEYSLKGATENCSLELLPLIAFRDYHSTAHENGSLNPTLEIEPGSVRTAPYQGCPPLYLAHEGAQVRDSGAWYRNFEYDRERERGLDFQEDLYNPYTLVLDLGRHPRQRLIASTERHAISSADALLASEIQRRNQIDAAAANERPFVQALARAADQYLVKRGEGNSVIAGYHWFSDWGRDTMIALPGLTLSTGRPDVAKNILLAFAASVDRGMLPNRFPDAGETPEYNTVDATLWFFEAVRAYLAHTGDFEFVQTHLYEVLKDIISWHERGTRYGIRVDDDGLLMAGEPGVQLTWMDAKVGDWVVTPRHGKPVEIEALWYNALGVMEDLAQRFLRESERVHYRALADRAQANFSKLFWNSSAGCLYDVVNGDSRDASIRPNQIFAVCLPHKMLTADQSAQVVETVQRHLLTPFGLRSLAPSDPQYQGRYGGDPRSRDGAYHQGTVWPWLIGPFLKAYVEVNGRSPKALQQAASWLSELSSFIENEGVGQLPEVFDGDAPHRPGGCIAQAWSVAELLRTCVEDVYQLAGPKTVPMRAAAKE
jgi:predicted glycogen debranching enzyme